MTDMILLLVWLLFILIMIRLNVVHHIRMATINAIYEYNSHLIDIRRYETDRISYDKVGSFLIDMLDLTLWTKRQGIDRVLGTKDL